MNDDYQLDDEACPRCGHSPTHYRLCSAIGCDDGWIDDRYDEDPGWYDQDDPEMCDECHGTGIEKWCPSCGVDIQAYNHSDSESGSGQAAGMGEHYERIIMPEPHVMILRATGKRKHTELWYCPICDRTLLVEWDPFKIIPLVDGDETTWHTGSTGGLNIAGIEVNHEPGGD